MFRLVIFATLTICAFGAVVPGGLKPKYFQERIVGGSPVEIFDVPYQIGLLYFDWHRCGGALIRPNVVITAAHCVEGLDLKDLAIRAGTDGRQEGEYRKITKYIVHENYGDLDYDVAILLLNSDLPLSNRIKLIDLAGEDEVIHNGDLSFVTGWGALTEGGESPEQLYGAEIPMVERAKCQELYGSGITDRMICAGMDDGGVDSCQGDSGGPLVLNKKLSGIVSWGYGCARPGYPGVYASVASLRKWIDQNS